MGRKFVRPQPATDHTDHVWMARVGSAILANDYKCLLCGGVTFDLPPTPTPADWLPDYFELPLTDEERALARTAPDPVACGGK